MTIELEMPAILVAPIEPDDDSEQERARYRRESNGMRAAIAAETQRQVEAAHENMRAAGRRYVGASAAVRIDVRKQATTREPSPKRNPTFATGGQLAVFFEQVMQRRAWRAAYAYSLRGWCAGDRDIVFPVGTWWMRVHHGAQCESLPSM